jgi:hypothetical protein
VCRAAQGGGQLVVLARLNCMLFEEVAAALECPCKWWIGFLGCCALQQLEDFWHLLQALQHRPWGGGQLPAAVSDPPRLLCLLTTELISFLDRGAMIAEHLV